MRVNFWNQLDNTLQLTRQHKLLALVRFFSLLLITVFLVIILTSCKPEINSIAPLNSDPSGGEELTIQGNYLDGGEANITIGDKVMSIEERTKKKIRARVPAGDLGPTELRIDIGKDFSESHSFEYLFRRIVTVARADEAKLLALKSLIDRKEALIAEVQSLGVDVLENHKDLPTLVLGIRSDEGLNAVTNSEFVAGIDKPRKLRIDTTESLPIIKRNWARNLPEPLGGLNMGAGTTVLVLDTGLNWRNPFFRCPTLSSFSCRIAKVIEFAPDDGRDDEPSPHGTNVSAIVLSVAPAAKIIGGDVFGGNAESDVIPRAIQWAVENRELYNIAAVNMSFSVPGTETDRFCGADPISAAVSFARVRGIVMIASTSNDSLPNSLLVPGCAPAAVRVGATYDSGPRLDQEADFSNAWALSFMVAPGSYITAGGIRMQGTSQAAPHVAGAAAVLRSAFPDASVDFIEGRLTRTGPVIPSKNSIARPRRLDLYAALADQTNRPAPAPKHFEWFWTAERLNGSRAPVSDRPKLESDISGKYLLDTNTGFSWIRRLPEDSANQSVGIRRAQEFCRNANQPYLFYRLPTRSELATLIDYNASLGERLKVPELGKIANGRIWTISPSRNYSENGDLVWTGRDGYLSPIGASSNEGSVLCVSRISRVPSQPPPTQFVINQESVIDQASGLRWLKETGPSSDYFEATDWCTKRTEEDRFWRLPSIKESLSITGVIRKNGMSIDPNIFGQPETRITSTDFRTSPGTGGYPRHEWWKLDERFASPNPSRSKGSVRCVENLDPAASHDGVHIGDVVINGTNADEKYQRFVRSGFREVKGDVIVNAPDLPRVSFQRLERVDGDIIVGGLEKAEYIALPRLTEVTGQVVVARSNVTVIDMTRLSAIGRDLIISDNPMLGVNQPRGTNGDFEFAPIRLRNLKRIGGKFELSRNRNLKRFDFRYLDIIGTDMNIDTNAELENFSANLKSIGANCPPRGQCGTLWVGYNYKLDNFRFPDVETIRWGIDIKYNPLLERFSAIAEMNALYKVENNENLCAFGLVDGQLQASLRRRIMARISVRGNRPDTPIRRCSSRCIDQDRCELWPNPIGSKESERLDKKF